MRDPIIKGMNTNPHDPAAPASATARSDADSLEGRMLLAMPGLADPRFSHAVIYMCAHNEDGAMGLIVNKPAPDLKFASLLKQLRIAPGPRTRDLKVHFGGPVEMGRGFVLHSDDMRLPEGTRELSGGLCLTASVEILESLANGGGPREALLALGYAGWGPGQLEAELAQNGWLECPADHDLIFDPDDARKWEAAMRRIGVDPALLSSEGGHA
ncbi:YqgE/AlgH family protein [Oceanicella actignis]|uniref:YqgE/AlgH family protein n=1 Tax=Oceanicella actignis TaxID=1189325 RepID=UPI0012596F95|nr:YqgE/AlgH family protein [Oceanicella actignis]TYO89661.1 putative transcriptional regulator [Oceanicella actignis]